MQAITNNQYFIVMRTILSRLLSLAFIIVATTFAACDVEEDNPVSDTPGDFFVGSNNCYINPEPKIDLFTMTVDHNGTYFTGTLNQYHLTVRCDSIIFEDFTLDTRRLGDHQIHSNVYFEKKTTVTLIGNSHIYYYTPTIITSYYPITLQGEDATLTLHFPSPIDISYAVKQFAVASGYIMGVSMPEEAPGGVVVTIVLSKKKEPLISS